MFEVSSAKQKAGKEEPPTQASMRASSTDKIRRNPSTDQRKVRRQMSKKAMTKVAWSIEDARQVLSGGASKVDGMLLDHFSASALVQIFDALSPENQAKLEAMSLDKAMDVVWKLAAKHSGSVHTASLRTAQNYTMLTVRGVDNYEYDWGYEFDDDYANSEGEPAVIVYLYNRDGEIVDSVGGVTLASLNVSDHGNTNVSNEDEKYLYHMAQDLATNFYKNASLRTASGWTEDELRTALGEKGFARYQAMMNALDDAGRASFQEKMTLASIVEFFRLMDEPMKYPWEKDSSLRTAGRPGDEAFDEYEKDDWDPRDGEPKYPELAEDDDDLFYEDFAHEASSDGDVPLCENHFFDRVSGDAPAGWLTKNKDECAVCQGRKEGSNSFAIADPTDIRPLHTRVAAAFLKKG